MSENKNIEWGTFRLNGIKPGDLVLKESRSAKHGLESVEVFFFDTPEKDHVSRIAKSRPGKNVLGKPALDSKPDFGTYVEFTEGEVSFTPDENMIRRRKATSDDLRAIVMGMRLKDIQTFVEDIKEINFSEEDKATLLQICDEAMKLS